MSQHEGSEQGNVAAPSSGTTETEEGMAAPPKGPQCPKCVTTGVVDILHDICKKQGMTVFIYILTTGAILQVCACNKQLQGITLLS